MEETVKKLAIIDDKDIENSNVFGKKFSREYEQDTKAFGTHEEDSHVKKLNEMLNKARYETSKSVEEPTGGV